MKQLEIGPGPEPLPGFETLNLRPPATYVRDCRNTKLPSKSFDLVYSSHCIEHIEWFDVEPTIREWVRILKPGGTLEVHTVNAYRLMKGLVELEETGETSIRAGKWRTDLHLSDPFLWATGRILSYAKKGDGGINLHRAILTPKRMVGLFERAGLTNLEEVAEPRGPKKHGGINMGLRGVKA